MSNAIENAEKTVKMVYTNRGFALASEICGVSERYLQQTRERIATPTSSMLVSLTYIYPSQTLVVEFRNGGNKGHYLDVTRDEWVDLRYTATDPRESAGQHLNSHIKRGHTWCDGLPPDYEE